MCVQWLCCGRVRFCHVLSKDHGSPLRLLESSTPCAITQTAKKSTAKVINFRFANCKLFQHHPLPSSSSFSWQKLNNARTAQHVGECGAGGGAGAGGATATLTGPVKNCAEIFKLQFQSDLFYGPARGLFRLAPGPRRLLPQLPQLPQLLQLRMLLFRIPHSAAPNDDGVENLTRI